MHANVDMFVSKSMHAKHYLSVPMQKTDLRLQNVMVASNNDTITRWLLEKFNNIEVETQPIAVAKALGTLYRMHGVVLMNATCDIVTEDECWEVYYFQPPNLSTEESRIVLHFSDTWAEKDTEE